jgi:hypothetical protein
MGTVIGRRRRFAPTSFGAVRWERASRVLNTQLFERRLHVSPTLAKRVAPGRDDRLAAVDRRAGIDDARVALVMSKNVDDAAADALTCRC